jgi:hypothetical protein
MMPPAAPVVGPPLADVARHVPHQPTTIDGVTYKVASCRQEREAAFRLIYDAYVEAKLMGTNAAQMRVTPWHILPSTDIFIAVHKDQVIHTISLISDDDCGIPLQCIYGDVVESLRKGNHYVAEFSCLASRKGHFPTDVMFASLVRLLALAAQYARYNDITKLLIAVHPRHARFYESFLGFKTIGELRNYPSVQNAPAVCCEHDFAYLDRERYKLYDHIYGIHFDRWQLLRQPMTAEERSYFSEAAELVTEAMPILAA